DETRILWRAPNDAAEAAVHDASLVASLAGGLEDRLAESADIRHPESVPSTSRPPCPCQRKSPPWKPRRVPSPPSKAWAKSLTRMTPSRSFACEESQGSLLETSRARKCSVFSVTHSSFGQRSRWWCRSRSSPSRFFESPERHSSWSRMSGGVSAQQNRCVG